MKRLVISATVVFSIVAFSCAMLGTWNGDIRWMQTAALLLIPIIAGALISAALDGGD